MSVVSGENSDLVIRGIRFHIQTEDWGFDAKVFVSRIFKDGSVVKTYKVAYEKVPKVVDPIVRRKAVLRLHQLVVEKAQTELTKF